jgi:ABC-type Mn2+/Zn2+ transport system permease subunit
MKKSKGILFVLFPVVITLALCVVFYSRIECKPSDAGFWFIIALGMSLGVALTRFSQWAKTKKSGDE